MDIACFFIGVEVSTAISIWKASGWRAEHALQTLKDKCLVEVSSYLGMHDHLRDLGREMSDKEMNPCRLWRPKDLIGMNENKGFQDIPMGSEGKIFRCFNNSPYGMKYFLESSKTSTDVQWLKFEDYLSYAYIPEWIPVQNLQTLIVGGDLPPKLWQRDDQAPLKLKELQCIFKNVRSFEDVFLRYGSELLSSLGMLKHLESLHLIFKTVYECKCSLNFLRELTSLKTLELSMLQIEEENALSKRGEKTDYRIRMRSLEALTLRHISFTRKVSISGQLCPTLKSLKLYSMEDLIEVDLTGVTTLERLELFRCKKLRKVLGNDLLKLEMFLIHRCWNMKELPNFGRVSCVKRINIRRCWSLQNISSIERLKELKRIWIAYCPNLQNINATEELKGLKSIWIENCSKLQNIIGYKELKELKRIFIFNCPELQNIEGIEFLTCLESIIIKGCPKLQNIRGIEELKGLKEMIILDTPIISCVERLQRLPWELTFLFGRSLMSDFNEAEIGDTLTMADAFCEIKDDEHVEKKFHSFIKTHHSLSTLIFCTLFRRFPHINRGINYGTCVSPFYTGPFATEVKWIGMCVGNEEMLSKYCPWMSRPIYRERAFLLGVKKGSERKTLHILQRLFAQLCKGYPEDVDYEEYDEEFVEYWYKMEDQQYDKNYPEDVEYDDQEDQQYDKNYPEDVEYDDQEDEESDGGNDEEEEDEEPDGGNEDYSHDVSSN